MSILRYVLSHVEFSFLGLQWWPFAAWLLRRLVPSIVDLSQSSIREVNIAEYFPRRGIGGGREGSGTELSNICILAGPVKSGSPQLVPVPSFFWVASENKGNRAIKTSREVSGGKHRQFFLSKPLAASRPVLRSLRRLTLKIAHKTAKYTLRESVMVGNAYWNMEASQKYDQASSLAFLFRLSFTMLLKILLVSVAIVKDHSTARFFLALRQRSLYKTNRCLSNKGLEEWARHSSPNRSHFFD